nr:hypothetical protein [Tanacetum cinerariifolium]
SNNDGDDFVHPKLSTHDEEAKDEESFDPIVQTPSHVENSDDENNDDESHGINVGGDEGSDAEDDYEELYRDVNINLEGRDSSSVSSQFVTSMLNPSPDTATAPSTSLQDLPNFSSLFGFDHRLKTLKANFSEFMETNQFDEVVSSIPGASQDTSLQDFTKIKKTVNEQLKAKVLTRASNSSKTSYAVAAELSELELKKILIEKMESHKSIQWFDEQRNLYKALVDAYECDKIILDTYGDTVTLKRRRDDKDKDEEPSAGSDRGDDDNIYKFKEGDLKRLHIQDIEDIMFTRSIVIQRRVKDLQLGVESYQKKLNLTKPDTYRSDLKCKEAYTAYSNPRGFIYQNKDKQNRLMRIDELHKFNDGMLNDVRTALDDCLKGIRMKYFPQTIWRRSDKERGSRLLISS